MVIPSGNSTAPIHRWFHLKEAFSRHLFGKVVHDLGLSSKVSLNIVDPFSGVGTSLISALDLCRSGALTAVSGHGLEVNPFLHAMAQAKASAAIRPPANIQSRLLTLADRAATLTIAADDIPSLSTLRNQKYFALSHAKGLVALRTAIEASKFGEDVKALARVALAMCVEPASRLRRDGRALRYENRTPVAPISSFRRAVHRIGYDLAQISGKPINATIEIALATAAQADWTTVPDDYADIVLFSPPYPNNIDYTEVYKIELWTLGYVADSEAFRNQRHKTLRSHPSVKFDRSFAYEKDARKGEVENLIGPILSTIPEASRYAAQLDRLIRGYADDMLVVFDAAYKALHKGGHTVYVVGNSVHGSAERPLLIAADVILGRLAEIAGFDVQEIRVARVPPRRKVPSEYVRESVVFLSKPTY